MSADNIIYVSRKPNSTVFQVWDQSASCDAFPSQRATDHPTIGEALEAAHKLEDEIGYVEYGVHLIKEEQP